MSARARNLARDLNRARDRSDALAAAFDWDFASTPNLALALARDIASVLDLARDLAPDLARDLARDLDLARDIASALTPVLDLAPHIDLARDITRARDLARDLARDASVRGKPAAVRVAPAAGRLLAAAARLLPAADRARYGEEYRAELWELAHAGAGRRGQLAYAARQVVSALHLQAELRSPRQRKAAP